MSDNIESIEKAVLGALLLERVAIDRISENIRAESFASNFHKRVYIAIMSLYSSNEPIDILTVTRRAKELGLDIDKQFSYGLCEIAGFVSSTANLEFHCKILKQAEIRRELSTLAISLPSKLSDQSNDVFDLLESVELKLGEIQSNLVENKFAHISKGITEKIKQLDSPAKDLIGVASGLSNLDYITLGFQAEKLYIIAARPAMGKTMFALNLARNAALQGVPTAFVSIEMGSAELINRLLTIETGIESNRILQNRLSHDERASMAKLTANLANSPLYIDDSAKISIMDFKTKARRIKREKGAQIIFVDYLQLIKGSNPRNREAEIAEISNELKGLSKSLKIPIIALSQLSREAEKSKDKRPTLAHLRESGAIEQDADVVMFLYRPEYYNIMSDANGVSTLNLTEVLIDKHRGGACGKCELFCELKYGKYSVFDDHAEKKPIFNSPNITPIKDAIDIAPPF